MNNSFSRHPEDGLLLRFIDGELPARKARQIQKHLEACWQCRTELEELKATVADCIRYRRNVLGAHLPEAPNPWQDLSRGFARVDASLAADSLLMRVLRPSGWRWSMAAAAAIVLIAVLIYQLRETPSVQAAGLLKRAVAASLAQPAKAAHRVRFRTRSQQFIRAAAPGQSRPPLPPAMEARFEQAHYDSTDPLSARAYQGWRDSVKEKQDEVTTVTDPAGGNCYRIHTSTTDGDVAAATLMLRTADLMPVEGLLEFRDSQWIEFSEFAESPEGSNSAKLASPVEVPERPAVPPSRLAVVPPRSSVSVSDELQVLSALHRIGADLGDPIQVTRTADQVIVSGEGVSPQRRQLIQRTLESMPHVAVQFSEPVAAAFPEGSASAAAAPSGTARATVPNSSVQSRLEEQLGGRAELERFSSRILDVNEGVMSRAYALRLLAQRFPAADESQLKAEDRHVLRDMAREHLSALSSTVNSLQRALNPVLTSLGGAAAQPPAASGATWQASADSLVSASHRVEVLLSVLLGVAPGQSSVELPSQVMSAVSDLRADLDRCQQLLAQEGGG